MDTVAIYTSGVNSRVGHWDGSQLALDWWKGPFCIQTLNEIVSRYRLGPGYHLLALDDSPNQQLSRPQMSQWAKSAGAESLRWFESQAGTNPRMVRAMHVGNAHRLGSVILAGFNDHGIALSTHDPTGEAMHTFEVFSKPRGDGHREFEFSSDQVDSFLNHQRNRGVKFDWMAGGNYDAGVIPMMATEAGADCVLVPDYVGMLEVVGMIAGPIAHELIEVPSNSSLDTNRVRECIARLMERSAEIVMAEGCDLDNSTTTCYVELSEKGRPPLPIRCGPVAEAENLLADYAAARKRLGARRRSYGNVVIVNRIRIRTVIELPTIHLPPPEMALSTMEYPFDKTRLAAMRLKGPVLSHRDFCRGDTIRGPAVIREPWSWFAVPDHWSAKVTMAGGVLLRRDVSDNQKANT